MKHIDKRKPPKALVDYLAQENEDWKPAYPFDTATQNAVRSSLLREQGTICCYCCISLYQEEFHIEHFRPQREYPELQTDYTNLHISCTSGGSKRRKTQHCGEAKGDWFDPAFMISPLDPDCEKRFIYTGIGEIHPEDESDNAALTTVERLNLNNGLLTEYRSQAMTAVKQLLQDVPQKERQDWVRNHLERDKNGSFKAFWPAIAYALFSHIENDLP